MLRVSDHSTKSLELSILIFILVCIVIIVSTMWTTIAIDRDALAINISGRQRMLSQRIAKNIFILRDPVAITTPARNRIEQELYAAADMFDNTLSAFSKGGTVHSTSGEMIEIEPLQRQQMRQIIVDAMEIWRPFYQFLDVYRQGISKSENALSQGGLDNLVDSESLLRLMNNLTLEIERSAQQKTNTIRAIQLAAMFIAMVLFGVVLRLFHQHLESARRNQHFLNDVLNGVDECVLLCTEDGLVVNCNMPAETLFDYDHEDLLSSHSDLLIKTIEGEKLGCRRNGEFFYAKTNRRPLDLNGCELWMITVHDITERKQSEKALLQLAYYDPLTKLPNRALILERIRHEIAIATRHNQTFALFFIDLDNFKNVNDYHGHEIGDAFLVEIGRCLRGLVRESDTVGRLGGDEFVALFAEVDNREKCEILANKIITAISSIELVAGVRIADKVGASVGISIYPTHGSQFEELLSAADEAMYLAKASGKGGVQWAVMQGGISHQTKSETEQAVFNKNEMPIASDSCQHR